MKTTRDKLVEEFNQLDHHERAKVLTFADLLMNCPGFKAELRAATKPGDRLPPFEVVEALMGKWTGQVATA